MPLQNSNNVLKNALNNHYGVGAFNFTNMEQLNAIIDSAEEMQSPAILAVSESAIDFCGLDTIVSMVKAKTKNKKSSFVLHLDHGKNFDICKKCVDAGFTSVMIDGSYLPFEKNIEITKQVVNYAHKKNVSVEGELGILKGVEDNIKSSENIFTSPTNAKIFCEKTGIDSLAVSIGTSHGAYKFKGPERINLEILKQIHQAIPNIPLVLHGASSINKTIIDEFNKSGGNLKDAKGVSNSTIKKCVQMGICKINTDSDLRIVYTTAIRNTLKNPDVFSPRDYLMPAINALKKLIKEKIITYKG